MEHIKPNENMASFKAYKNVIKMLRFHSMHFVKKKVNKKV